MHSDECSSLSKVASVANGDYHPVDWNEVNQRRENETIERERLVREDPVAFKKWCAALYRKEEELRDMRNAEDHEYAIEMQKNEDAKFARQLDREERESVARRESTRREIADQKL